MRTPLLFFGASGHAKVLIDIAERMGCYKIIGLIDSFRPKGTVLMDYTVLGNDLDLPSVLALHPDSSIIISIGDNGVRMKLREQLSRALPSIGYATLIHPSAQIGRKVTIGQGSCVMAGSVINSDARVGEGSIVNSLACVEHDCEIGPFCSIGSGVTLGGGVRIGTGSAVLPGAVVRHGVSIGEHCVIEPGSVVTKDCPPYRVVAGVQATGVRSRMAGDKYL